MEKKIIQPQPVYTARLVKSEDLNHHGTLFAGRTAEWFVESGFISVAKITDPEHVVCLKVHGMHFTRPVKPGEVVTFTSKVVHTGSSSLVAHIAVTKEDSDIPFVSGFITFIHVDEHTHSSPHFIEIVPKTEADIRLQELAKALGK